MDLQALRFKLSMPLPIALILLVASGACTRPASKRGKITKVEVAISIPLQNKITIVSVDSSLSYGYYGKKGNGQAGYYTGRINKGFWDTLAINLEKIKYKTLRTSAQDQLSMDAPMLMLIVSDHGQTTKFHSGIANLSKHLRLFMNWVAGSYKQVRLNPMKDTIRFESWKPVPPIKKYEQVKFPKGNLETPTQIVQTKPTDLRDKSK